MDALTGLYLALVIIVIMGFIVIPLLMTNRTKLREQRNDLLLFIIHHRDGVNNHLEHCLEITIKDRTLIVDDDDYQSYTLIDNKQRAVNQ